MANALIIKTILVIGTILASGTDSYPSHFQFEIRGSLVTLYFEGFLKFGVNLFLYLSESLNLAKRYKMLSQNLNRTLP